MRYLLDVNLWIALFDDAHTHSARANSFIAKRTIKIATCPLVENGVIRVLNLPNYALRGAVGIDQVRQQLKHATTELDHEFWPDDVSMLDDKRIDFGKISATTRYPMSICWRLRLRIAGHSSRSTSTSP